MIQFQFLLRNLDESEQISESLQSLGIEEHHIHFLSRDAQSIFDHAVDSASVFEERDILHSGFQGAIWGGIIALTIIAILYIFDPFSWQLELTNVILLFALFVGFFAWLGGLVGLNHDNYKVAPFHEYLVSGQAILLIYSYDEFENDIVNLMKTQFPTSSMLGKHSALDNPLVFTKLVEYD